MILASSYGVPPKTDTWCKGCGKVVKRWFVLEYCDSCIAEMTVTMKEVKKSVDSFGRTH